MDVDKKALLCSQVTGRYLAAKGRRAGRSLFWSSCCVHCRSPAGCLLPGASCLLQNSQPVILALRHTGPAPLLPPRLNELTVIRGQGLGCVLSGGGLQQEERKRGRCLETCCGVVTSAGGGGGGGGGGRAHVCGGGAAGQHGVRLRVRHLGQLLLVLLLDGRGWGPQGAGWGIRGAGPRQEVSSCVFIKPGN